MWDQTQYELFWSVLFTLLLRGKYVLNIIVRILHTTIEFFCLNFNRKLSLYYLYYFYFWIENSMLKWIGPITDEPMNGFSLPILDSEQSGIKYSNGRKLEYGCVAWLPASLKLDSVFVSITGQKSEIDELTVRFMCILNLKPSIGISINKYTSLGSSHSCSVQF